MNYHYPVNCDTHPTGVLGTSIDLSTENLCVSELRADIMVEEFQSVRVWGQIVNCQGQPVPNALLKLVKLVCNGNQSSYQGVAHTVSDCNGFYQFDLCNNEAACYKILVGKSVTGSEAVIELSTGNCSNNCQTTCNGGSAQYPVCGPTQPPKTIPPMSCNCNCGYPPQPHTQHCSSHCYQPNANAYDYSKPYTCQ